MTKLSTMNVASCKAIRKAMEKALAEVEQELGVKFEYGNMRYATDGSFSMKVEGCISSSGETPSMALARKMAKLCGYPMVSPDGKWELTGYNDKAHKYPWIVNRAGKSYKLSREHMKSFFLNS